MSSRPTWATQVPGQPELYSITFSRTKGKVDQLFPSYLTHKSDKKEDKLCVIKAVECGSPVVTLRVTSPTAQHLKGLLGAPGQNQEVQGTVVSR